MKNLWQTLAKQNKPLLIQAPMEDVTDTVFRQVLLKVGKPHVFFTEFTSTDGILSKGRNKVIQRLSYSSIETPLIAQIWGNKPENYFSVAQQLAEMGFAGIDINLGCPVKKGSCVALINNPHLVSEIIHATKEGAPKLPISVKTRIGLSTIQTEEWIGFLLEQNLDALTVHGRTKKEMSKVPAHWDEIGKAVMLKKSINPHTVLIGNGDVISFNDAVEKTKIYGVDGIMVGRGMFTNLWIFNPNTDPTTVPLLERLKLLKFHLELFNKTWGHIKKFDIMKKYYKIYISNFDGASELRSELVVLSSIEETIQKIDNKIALL